MNRIRHSFLTAFTLMLLVYPFIPLLEINGEREGLSAAAASWEETDPMLPATAIEINQAAEFTRDGLVEVSAMMRGAIDSAASLTAIRYATCGNEADCATKFAGEVGFGSWQDLSQLREHDGVYYANGKLMLGDPQSSGVRGICVQVKDSAGRVSPWHAGSCDTIILDNVAPTGSALIADGAAETDSLDLWGTVSATDSVLADGSIGVGGIEYSVSGDNIPWQSWQKLNGSTKVLYGTYPVTVTTPTVIRGYVKFRDKLGNESPVYSDDILYRPVGDQPLPDQDDSAFWINDREAFTSIREVNLHFSTTKLVSTIKIWNKGENSDQVAKRTYQPQVSWELTPGYEQKVIYAQFFYADGTSSAGMPAEITFAPVYGIEYAPAITGYSEFTLGSFPDRLTAERPINFVISAKNIGSLSWEDNETSKKTGKPTVHVSYHWYREWRDGTRTLYEYHGNRGSLNTSLGYLDTDSNVRLQINAPEEPGTYIIQIDAVRENPELANYTDRQYLTGKSGDWFSNYGNQAPEYQVEIVDVPTVAGSITPELLQSDQLSNTSLFGSAVASSFTAQSQTTAQGVYYVVQSPHTWDPSWRCGGYDCYTGIAEEYYQCKARGMDNSVPAFATRAELQYKCWWPIFAANELNYGSQIPLQYRNTPWNYLQVGWVLYIPSVSRPGGVIDPGAPKLPEMPTGFQGIDNTITPENPYGGFNGNTPHNWPQVTFDRYVAWDGSYKTDQLKWSETRRPTSPTITAMQTNEQGTSVRVYGVAIPKGHPVSVRVWNEYRYCWACGSGWEFFYQQGTAQHVKVVLFTRNWEYLGEVWNDNPEGKWSIDISLNSKLKPGDYVFAEVQIEADYTFNGLHWWADTTETVNFNLRNPKYTGYPYFASGAGQGMNVPVQKLTNPAEWAFIYREQLSTGFNVRQNVYQNKCGAMAKDYSYLTNPGDSWQTFTTLVYNPNINWAFRLRGNILFKYIYWPGQLCTQLGLPTMDDAWAATSPEGTTGAYQRFAGGDIYSSTLGTYVVKGVIKEEFDQKGGTSYYGFPLEDQTYRGGKLVQKFEAHDITINPCGDGLKWDEKAEECVLPKEWDCRQIGMHRYVNPNNGNDIVCAKINAVPYINQKLDKWGIDEKTVYGEYTCGSSSISMIAGAEKKVSNGNYESLKNYVIHDSDIKHTEPIRCSQFGGIFARTITSCLYWAHEWWLMDNILSNTFDLQTSDYATRLSMTSDQFYADVKSIIDNGGYVLQGVGGNWLTSGHIFVIKGYSDENLDGKVDGVIVNDSYRNLMDTSSHAYSFSGNGAIYEFNKNGWVFRSYYNIY